MIRRTKQPLWRNPMVVLAGGLALIAVAVVGGFVLFGGDDPGSGGIGDAVREKTPTQSRSGTAGGPDQVFSLTPAEASLNLEELPTNYQVDRGNTFAMNITTFASSYWFRSNAEGEDLSREWRIINGFQVFYQPVGLAAEVLAGAAYIRIETYQFADQDGAQQAFNHLDALMKRTTASEAVEAKPLANDWGAYRILEGTVGVSDTLGVFHRFNFRRGNFVVSVHTWGAEPFMNIDAARNIAAAVDDKLLGTRPAVEPTPIPTPSFPGLGN